MIITKEAPQPGGWHKPQGCPRQRGPMDRSRPNARIARTTRPCHDTRRRADRRPRPAAERTLTPGARTAAPTDEALPRNGGNARQTAKLGEPTDRTRARARRRSTDAIQPPNRDAPAASRRAAEAAGSFGTQPGRATERKPGPTESHRSDDTKHRRRACVATERGPAEGPRNAARTREEPARSGRNRRPSAMPREPNKPIAATRPELRHRSTQLRS